MKDVTCAAQKTSIDTMTGAMSAASSADQLKQMFKIDVSGLKYDEKAGSGGNIVVVSGKMTMSILGQSQDQTMNNQEIPMVNEGGQWKVCGAALPGQ